MRLFTFNDFYSIRNIFVKLDISQNYMQTGIATRVLDQRGPEWIHLNKQTQGRKCTKTNTFQLTQIFTQLNCIIASRQGCGGVQTKLSFQIPLIDDNKLRYTHASKFHSAFVISDGINIIGGTRFYIPQIVQLSFLSRGCTVMAKKNINSAMIHPNFNLITFHLN